MSLEISKNKSLLLLGASAILFASSGAVGWAATNPDAGNPYEACQKYYRYHTLPPPSLAIQNDGTVQPLPGKTQYGAFKSDLTRVDSKGRTIHYSEINVQNDVENDDTIAEMSGGKISKLIERSPGTPPAPNAGGSYVVTDEFSYGVNGECYIGHEVSDVNGTRYLNFDTSFCIALQGYYRKHPTLVNCDTNSAKIPACADAATNTQIEAFAKQQTSFPSKQMSGTADLDNPLPDLSTVRVSAYYTQICGDKAYKAFMQSAEAVAKDKSRTGTAPGSDNPNQTIPAQ